ncbi:DUF397 domain-containing protein [Micromonospora lutea]|uniref:DUF397 domain-containing protein n=1 Tax=Micromonospora lutea TaxID=419825 RepID=A0ABQ4IXZ8_9ACTN|nr:DUF397 domain-containing protein [Micromonospora lutea]GIJ22789.1 hypothetical protein Vlu01_34130 [Micromonospora lutea]
MPDLTDALWRKSSRSNNGGNCIEVVDNLPGIIGLRDSKDPSGPVLTFRPAAWIVFVAEVKRETLHH